MIYHASCLGKGDDVYVIKKELLFMGWVPISNTKIKCICNNTRFSITKLKLISISLSEVLKFYG